MAAPPLGRRATRVITATRVRRVTPGILACKASKGRPGAAVVLRASDSDLTVGGMARLESLDPDWQTTTTTFGSANWTQSADEIDTFVDLVHTRSRVRWLRHSEPQRQNPGGWGGCDGDRLANQRSRINGHGHAHPGRIECLEPSFRARCSHPTHPLRHVHQLVWSRVDPGDPDQQRAPRCSRHSLAPLSRASKLANPLESPSERRLKSGKAFRHQKLIND